VHDTSPEAGLPWYRFFWPWFIVILLTSSVVAALATVVFAVRNQDSLVDDRYNQARNAINQRLAAEANAERLGIRATLTIDELTGEVHVTLDGDLQPIPEHLKLELSHATQELHDAAVMLAKTGANRFYGQLQTAPTGRYYARLRPSDLPDPARDDATEQWRLQHEIRLPSRDPLSLGSSP
jgi:hypothetical protein